MSTRSLKAYREKQARDSEIHLRSLGYQSLIFNAKYNGGKCGLCKETIRSNSEVAYFRDKLSHVPCIDAAIRERDCCKNCRGVGLVFVKDVELISCPVCQ